MQYIFQTKSTIFSSNYKNNGKKCDQIKPSKRVHITQAPWHSYIGIDFLLYPMKSSPSPSPSCCSIWSLQSQDRMIMKKHHFWENFNIQKDIVCSIWIKKKILVCHSKAIYLLVYMLTVIVKKKWKGDFK